MKQPRLAGYLSLFLTGISCLPLGVESQLRADVLVGNFNGSDVLRYSDTGTPLSGGVSSGSGGLDAATGVAMGLDNNIYVSSRNTGEILRYDGTTGAFIDVFASTGGTPSSSLRWAGDGTLYVSNDGTGTVQHYDESGNFLDDAFSGMFFTGGFTIAPNGDQYAADFGAGLIYKKSYPGGPQTLWANLNDTDPMSPYYTPPGPNGFLGGRTPSGLLVATNGDVYVADLFQNQLLRYNSSGILVGSPVDVDIPGQPIPMFEFPSNSPTAFVLGRDGQILLAAQGYTQATPKGAVLRYDSSLNQLSVFADTLASPAAITLTPPPFLLGDMDGDGTVNNFDILPFEQALTDPYLYLAAAPSMTDFRFRGDASGDSVFNNFDILPFEVLLTGGPGAAVPEPSTFVLMGLATVGGAWVAARRRARQAK